MYLMDIYKDEEKLMDKEIKVSGWIRNHRHGSNFGFIDLADGTSIKKLQVVYDTTLPNFKEVDTINFGSSIEVEGILKKGEGTQSIELKATKITLLGECSKDNPLQNKKHSK